MKEVENMKRITLMLILRRDSLGKKEKKVRGKVVSADVSGPR
jgi:hypothetical protein